MLNCRFRLNSQPVSELIVEEIGRFWEWLDDRSNDDWFSLYAIDDQIDDSVWCEGARRGEFRLHGGGRSAGCVNVIDYAQYTVLHDMIKAHGARSVPKSDLKAYGILEVI